MNEERDAAFLIYLRENSVPQPNDERIAFEWAWDAAVSHERNWIADELEASVMYYTPEFILDRLTDYIKQLREG